MIYQEEKPKKYLQEIEQVKSGNDTRYEIQSARIYGFQWKANGEFGRMIKSLGRRGVTLWCLS